NGNVGSLSDSGSAPISRQLAGNDSSPDAYVDPNGGTKYMPFRPVDGSAPINIQTKLSTNPANAGNVVWANTFFDYTTTNEADYSRPYPDATGSELFPADTGLEAPGLGCGEQVTQPHGPAISPQCWLVIVPRATPAIENPPPINSLFVQTPAVSG